jgi:glyoxalase/bleomycin resistance protein/dioxygenase superfamily protein
LPTLPEDQRDIAAAGLILAFVVDDLEGELARLQAEGVRITMPLTVEEWGSARSRSVVRAESSSSWSTGRVAGDVMETQPGLDGRHGQSGRTAKARRYRALVRLQ